MLQIRLRPLAQRKPAHVRQPDKSEQSGGARRDRVVAVWGTADDQPPLATQEVARHPQRDSDDARERANLLMGEQHVGCVGLGRQR